MEDESWDPTLTDSPLSSKSSISSSVSSVGRTGMKPKRMQSSYYDEEQGVSRCRNCGWTYPNPRPDSRRRRDHKKVCEGIMKKAGSELRAGACTDRDRGSPSQLLRIQERDDVTGSGAQDNSDGTPGPYKLVGNAEMIALETESFQIGSPRDPDLSMDDRECDTVGAGSQQGLPDDNLEDRGAAHDEDDRLISFVRRHDQNHFPPDDSQPDMHDYGSLQDRGDDEETREEEDRQTNFVQRQNHDHLSLEDSRSQRLNLEDNSARRRCSCQDVRETEEAANVERRSPISGLRMLTGPIQVVRAHALTISVIGILCLCGERFLSSRRFRSLRKGKA